MIELDQETNCLKSFANKYVRSFLPRLYHNHFKNIENDYKYFSKIYWHEVLRRSL